MPRSVDPIDVEIGRRVRAYRIARGMSQSQLGGKIGVRFQQIQKYEKGVNRVGGGRLKKIAAKLGLPIGALFGEDDKGEQQVSDGLLTETLSQPYASRLLTAFAAASRIPISAAPWSNSSRRWCKTANRDVAQLRSAERAASCNNENLALPRSYLVSWPPHKNSELDGSR